MTGCWILSGFEKWSVGRFVLWCMGSIRVTYSDIVLDTFWDDGAELEGSFVYHFVTLLAICCVFSKWYSGARQLTWGGCGSGGTGIGGFLFLSYGLRCVACATFSDVVPVSHQYFRGGCSSVLAAGTPWYM